MSHFRVCSYTLSMRPCVAFKPLRGTGPAAYCSPCRRLSHGSPARGVHCGSCQSWRFCTPVMGLHCQSPAWDGPNGCCLGSISCYTSGCPCMGQASQVFQSSTSISPPPHAPLRGLLIPSVGQVEGGGGSAHSMLGSLPLGIHGWSRCRLCSISHKLLVRPCMGQASQVLQAAQVSASLHGPLCGLLIPGVGQTEGVARLARCLALLLGGVHGWSCKPVHLAAAAVAFIGPAVTLHGACQGASAFLALSAISLGTPVWARF